MNMIYLRTSTEEQNPENQLESCKALADDLKIDNYSVMEDRVSGWKELERENFDNITKLIRRKRVKVIICWDLDRLYRNRKRLIAFFELCKIYGCKIYSVRQRWLESINSIQEPFNEIMHSLMLQIMGWLAEEESNKKSERVKLAVRKKNGVTYSKNGNKWGRKALSKRVIKEVLELHNKEISIRKIAEQVYSWDRHGNKKLIGKSTVHKIISENKGAKS